MLYLSPFQILAAGVAGVLILRFLRAFVFAHPLDDIPGPETKSLLKGLSYSIHLRLAPASDRWSLEIGNLDQVFSSDSRDFHRSLSESCESLKTM